MKLSFRWYGDSDPISLEYISQIPGMRSIVTAVYDVKPGEVWPEESLARLKAQCEEHGLVFDVVESIPVSEDIKLGTEKRDAHIEAYCENVRRCAKYGVKCVTYNFMPVFDWTRTQLDKKGPGRLHQPGDVLGADAGLEPPHRRHPPAGMGLQLHPGAGAGLNPRLRRAGREGPVEEHRGVPQKGHPRGRGVRRGHGPASRRPALSHLRPAPCHHLRGKPGPLSLHCGLPLQRFVPVHRLPGLRQVQRRARLVRKYSAAGRIGFMHLRNVKILEDGSFEERAHLSSCGSLDMYEIVKAWWKPALTATSALTTAA